MTARRGPHWGRRHRRVRRTAATLTVLLAVGGLLGWLVYRATRPQMRRPGEALADITQNLSHDLPAEAPEPRFVDVTVEAGLGDFVTFAGERTSQLPEDMGAGAAWGDVDNDGDDDLFLVAAGGALTLPADERAPSLLYENLGGGRFRRVESFPAPRILGMAAAWADYDLDGWLDLAVSGYRTLLLFHNEEGRLVPGPELPVPDGYWAGLAWGDFDGDRDPDLYVCGYVRYEEDAGPTRRGSNQYGTSVPYTLNPASFEPEANLLLVNRGQGVFEEMALLHGVSNPEGRSLGAVWHDFDDDGRLDLYVANDISDNALYLNRGDTFEDAGLAAWVADYRGAMGLAVGDWNRDGDDDLFVTHWLAQENALYDSRLLERSDSTAPLTFSDLAAPLGLGQIALPMVGWGTEFADLDADGWLDLVVVNGSTLETREEPRGLVPQPAMLLWNDAGRAFHDLATLDPELARPRVGRGLALADVDGDGDLDLLVVDLAAGATLLANETERGRWLALRLRDRPRPDVLGFADGAVATARIGEVALRRTVGGGSYLSQGSRVLHFGLGEAQRVDDLTVRWPGGESASYGPLEAGALWEITEDDPTPRRVVTGATAAGTIDERERVRAFWETQRSAMDAMKRDGDLERAVELFRRALELDPAHEDSRYYLANCLAALGDPQAALAELDTMRRLSPGSHRAHKQWGVLRALTARDAGDLAAATAALERALEINREETGSLLVLGEIALLQGRNDLARQRLEWACSTNPRATGGFFLRGYLAWKAGDAGDAAELLEAARATLGEDWKPEGAAAEGDVATRMHRETTPLSPYWRQWDGGTDPAAAFAALEPALADFRPRS
jgi:tetratricopeptide (TPR) repeat protein